MKSNSLNLNFWVTSLKTLLLGYRNISSKKTSWWLQLSYKPSELLGTFQAQDMVSHSGLCCVMIEALRTT